MRGNLCTMSYFSGQIKGNNTHTHNDKRCPESVTASVPLSYSQIRISTKDSSQSHRAPTSSPSYSPHNLEHLSEVPNDSLVLIWTWAGSNKMSKSLHRLLLLSHMCFLPSFSPASVTFSLYSALFQHHSLLSRAAHFTKVKGKAFMLKEIRLLVTEIPNHQPSNVQIRQKMTATHIFLTFLISSRRRLLAERVCSAQTIPCFVLTQ